jgi:hypothetical protein
MSVKLTMLEGTMAHLHCSFDIYIFSKIKEVNAQEGALKNRGENFTENVHS